MAEIYNICDFGAIGDGEFNCTDALQQAIDKCSADGGGTVLVPRGRFLFYPLRLRSNVRLEITDNAVLLAGTDPELYPELQANPHWKIEYSLRNNRRCVIYAEGEKNVAICGHGKIDFQGLSFVEVDLTKPLFSGKWKRKSDTMIPGRSLFFVSCQNVSLEDVLLVDTAGWFTWFLDCERVRVRGITMRADLRMPNSDGIHIGSCRNVIVSDCDLVTGDDSIIVRSMQEQFDRPIACEDVVVTNCILQSGSQAIRIGWTHDYAMRNCTFSNLVIKESTNGIGITMPPVGRADPPRYPDTPQPYPDVLPFAVENIQFSNISMFTRGRFFNISLDPNGAVDYIRGISMRGIHAVASSYPRCVATKSQNVSDIEFDDVCLEIYPNPGTPDAPPGAMDFRGVKNVIMHNFRIKEATE